MLPSFASSAFCVASTAAVGKTCIKLSHHRDLYYGVNFWVGEENYLVYLFNSLFVVRKKIEKN